MSTTKQGTNSATSLAATPPDGTFSQVPKQPRVLACLLCQHRKVKCNRNFPCANCTRSHARCVPAATQIPRQRRRRFPERELLDRLRHYESLLRRNDIPFQPLHGDHSTTGERPLDAGSGDCSHDSTKDEPPVSALSADQASSSSTKVKAENVYETKSFWDAMNQRPPASRTSPLKVLLTIRNQSRYSDDDTDSSAGGMPEAVVKDAWNELYQEKNNDHLLFGSRDTDVDISTLHPEQVQIFRLWQVYLDNVNPLLKVTHTPTLQTRIIDAASNVASIEPTLAALMLSIYCVAILSLGEEECLNMFNVPRERLLLKYQLGCRQALTSCGFLRSDDRDCLTALYLYLISVKPGADPQSLSSMLAAAIRTAQRMGLNKESANVNFHALEAEFRRRLWWSLVLFDTRLCEMSDYTTTILTPTWDCKIPLNLNDFDLQPETKAPPAAQGKSSEALFAVMRSELGNFVRHGAFHLDFVNPALKILAKINDQNGLVSEGDDFATMEKTLEHNHLRFCNPENPLHFMTIWTARGHIAKTRLLEHYSRFPGSSVPQTDAQRNVAICHALSMLECDTNLMTSPLTKGYRWFIDWYFPFPAYLHLFQDLRMRPLSDHAQHTWEIMTENYEARFRFKEHYENPLYKAFTKLFLQAWEANKKAFGKSEAPRIPPRIVSDMQARLAKNMQDAHGTGKIQFTDFFDMSPDSTMSMLEGHGSYNLLSDMGGQNFVRSETQSTPYQHVPRQPALEFDLNDTKWTPRDWNPWYQYDWGSW